MDKQEYIMIGAKTITKEVFRNILRPTSNYTYLPTGGFWSCKYDKFKISEWFNYILDSNDLINSKKVNEAIIFKLKDNAKILIINDYNDLKQVINNYPSYHHLLNFYTDISSKEESINFELLNKDYDGIYVNYEYFKHNNNTIIFNSWAVNTLLLFNLDAIDSYNKVNINFLLPDSYSYYILEKEPTIYHIEEESIYHKDLYNYIEVIFDELANNKRVFNDYDEYFSHLIEVTKESINLALIIKKDIATIIKKNLVKQNIIVTEEIIIRNIAISILSNYLKKNIEQEQRLGKTKKREKYVIREYPIEENKK